MNATQPINGLITARLTPSGGATAGAVVSQRYVTTEETNAGANVTNGGFIRNGYSDVSPLRLREGQGIRVIQGSVASVGNIGFDVIFRVIQR